jgi:ABC-type bacteriocin/lantibiotic exporter with double-glycine peptidase domain
MLKRLRPFAVHLRGKGLRLAALFALGLAGAAVSLSTPLVGKAFVDAVVTRRDFETVPWIAGVLVGLALLDLVTGYATRMVHTKLSAAVLVELRQRLFQRCLHSPLDRLESFRHGDLMSRFGGDLTRVQTLLVDGFLGSLQHLLFLAVAAAILFRLSPSMALWSFVGVALALVATAGFRAPVESGTRGIREAMADLSHFLSERLNALRSVRLHGTQSEEADGFSRVNDSLVQRVIKFQRLDAAASGVPGLLLTLSLAWIYLLGGGLLEAGEISLGTFVAFVLYQGRLYAPARGLLGLVRSLQESRVSLGRVADVFGPESDVDPEPALPSPSRKDVVFAGVSFAYPGKPALLRDLDLRLAPGERVALFGASGAGKSTLVHLLFGLRTPHEGRIEIGGAEPSRSDAVAFRRALGYAGAEPFLLHASVEENLRYGNPDATAEALLEAARLAAANDFILSLPEGFRTVIGGRGLALSDGQRQRIGLARLFLRAPLVFVLDEAFSALDPETEARVRRNLWAAFPDRTALVITHRLGGLDEFGRLLVLRDGRLVQVEEGDVREVLARAGSDG